MSPPSDPDDLGFALPSPARTSRVAVFVVIALAVGGAFAFGYLRKQEARGAVPTPAGTARRVEVIAPKVLASDHPLALPGTVRALEETQLFARVTGYVKAWHVDLGDKVTAGQLLAEIDAPELASQLAQARAQLASAKAAVKQAAAQRDFSASTSTRYTTLADQQLVAKAQVEETEARAKTAEATLNSAESNVLAAEANVRRLAELQSFTRVVAPFAGAVTQRAIERGALVREGSSGLPLFTIVAIDPVRVLVDVPQSIATNVRPGAEATVTVREYGDRGFAGKVTRAAGALDPQLHTMTTEIQVPNPDGALLPGMYVQASLAIPIPHHVLEIPATALYSDASGTRVATIDASGRAHYVKIEIQRDTGATLQISTGLTGGERILKIAIPALMEGEPVEVAGPPAAPKAAATQK